MVVDIKQFFETYLLYGRPYNRIEFGAETNIEREKVCDACGVYPKEYHRLGCLNEQCPCCGKSSTTCECVAFDACSECESKECLCAFGTLKKVMTTEELGILESAQEAVKNRYVDREGLQMDQTSKEVAG
jgi:hypothetical protein